MDRSPTSNPPTKTDEELDRDWKPSGRRPQSTIARSFSAELMDIFRIENSVADLDEKVDKRKAQVNSQTSELQALEARIKEMEARLKAPKPSGSGGASPTSPRQRPGVANAFESHPPPPPVPRDGAVPEGKSRPGTARASQQAVPGALPPTPTASEDGDRE